MSDEKLNRALHMAERNIGKIYPAWWGKSEYSDDPQFKDKKFYRPHKTRKHATTDAATLRQWWAENPNDNIKVLINPGYVVIDVDSIDGGHQDGFSHLAKLGDLPTTYTEQTPSSGRHYVYRLPISATFKNTLQDKTNLPGIEFLGMGAAFNASGSTTTKGKYTDNGLPVSDAPAHIVELITRLKPTAPTPRPTFTPATYTGNLSSEWARKWANETLDDYRQKLRTEPSGGRNRAARNVSYHIGTIAHLTGQSLDTIFELLATDISGWEDKTNDERTIKRGLQDGAKNEFTPRAGEFTPYWAICASLIQQVTATTWGGTIVIDGKTKRHKIRDKNTGEIDVVEKPLAIRLADVAAALMAIVELTLLTAKQSTISISPRQLAKRMLLNNHDTATWRLRALCQLGYLTMASPATHGPNPRAATYAITQKHVTDTHRAMSKEEVNILFTCVQSRANRDNTNTNIADSFTSAIPSIGTSLHTSSENVLSTSMLYARPQAARRIATTKHDSINGVVLVGADGKAVNKYAPGITATTITTEAYGGLGSVGRVITEQLKRGDMTTAELVTATGLSGYTVKRAIKILADDGAVVMGDGRKGERHCWQGLDKERLVHEFGTYERARIISAKHEIQRQKYNNYYKPAATIEPALNTTTTQTQPAKPVMDIASDDERTPIPIVEFDTMTASYAPQVKADGRLIAIREGAT
jgi:hypothetical protein